MGIREHNFNAASTQLIEALNHDKSLAEKIVKLEELKKVLRHLNLFNIIDQFDDNQPSTTSYWISYLKMVSMLLQCVRAEREGNWKLHMGLVTLN